MEAAVRVEGLTRRFGAVTAVDGVTFSVAPGEIFGLVGPDGAGKTTTLRLLTAILDPSAGEAWVAGCHCVREGEKLKEQIGYMSQRFGLYADLTVEENLHFYADIYGVPRGGRAEKMRELLAFSRLEPYRRRRAGNLSGGMKQKLGLACALIHTPRVLLLDEPTNGVDPVSRRDFWRILHRLVRDGVTIVVSTSYLDEAERCARVGLLHRGKLLACDTPDRVKLLMRGTILEVRLERPRSGARMLQQEYPELTVGIFGDRLHVVTSDPDRHQAELPARLAAAGLAIEGIRRIPPSLEDVFISVVTAEPAA